MNELIVIEPRTIGADAIETVNARDLHAFLEVGTRFNDWVAARIGQYGFVENQDFVTFTANPVKGRPTVEYAITLDMAKELAMVERNDKGKQARTYFIECERRAKQAHALPASTVTATLEASKVIEAVFNVMRLTGLDNNASVIAANQAAKKLTGADVLALTGQTHLPAADQTTRWRTPTELGRRIGVSPQVFNKMLQKQGFQYRDAYGCWIPTQKGLEYARMFDTGKAHTDGVATQLKWCDTLWDVLDITDEQYEVFMGVAVA